MHEVNRASAKIRRGYTFKIKRDAKDRSRFSVTSETNGAYGGAVLFMARPSSVEVRIDLDSRTIVGRWDESTGEERWFDQAIPDVIHTASEMSQSLLEAFFLP